MKIGIISQSPLWTTGFGVTCNRIAHSLINSGHTVCCFGLGEGEDSNEYPFKIYQVDWPQAYNRLSVFLREENPDTILINFDINAVAYFINYCKLLKWNKKIFAHLVMDGFPVYEKLLEPLREIDGIIVPTKSSKKYLRSEGITKVYYAPHGVYSKEFIPIKDKENIRLKLGLKGNLNNVFIVGVFAKNEERKQIPKVLLALHHLVYNLKQKDILLYLHTQAKPDINKGWDLEHIVNYLKLNRYVIFTAKNFRQDTGVNLVSHQGNDQQLTFIERINMCDLIVNIPFSGGFELCNIEAQSCGVPLITINDDGNISEVVGESALLINPIIKNIWGNGAIICMVDEIELAHKILQVKNQPELRESFRQKGFENVRKFSWAKLEKAVLRMIAS